MANKLRNIEAIRKMLDGTHRMQTKKSFGYEKQNVTRNVGDVWTDENGTEWEQKEGYKINGGFFKYYPKDCKYIYDKFMSNVSYWQSYYIEKG